MYAYIFFDATAKWLNFQLNCAVSMKVFNLIRCRQRLKNKAHEFLDLMLNA